MQKIFLFLVLLVAIASLLLLARYYKESQNLAQILNKERYVRMVAEEEQQKGEYRIKKLETQLETVEIKLSKTRELLNVERDESEKLSQEFRALETLKADLEGSLKQSRDAETDLRGRVMKASKQLFIKDELESPAPVVSDVLVY